MKMKKKVCFLMKILKKINQKEIIQLLLNRVREALILILLPNSKINNRLTKFIKNNFLFNLLIKINLKKINNFNLKPYKRMTLKNINNTKVKLILK